MSLSAAIDKAVKAYIDHTNAVLTGDSSLNVSYLTQPFNTLVAPQIAQFALQAHQNGGGILPPPSLAAGAGAGPLTSADLDAVVKRKKRAYKPRDPNAPKRPLTAYFRFLHEIRPILTEKMAKDPTGSHKPGDLSKEATDRWNNMPQAERDPYHNAYKEAMKQYSKDHEAYKAKVGTDLVEENALALAMAKPAEDDDDDDDGDDDDDDDDDDDTEDDEIALPPPPPPKKAATPRSAMKKEKKPAAEAPTPRFSSINPPEASAPASSPPAKAKSAAAAKRKPEPEPEVEDEEPKKKRGRANKADKAQTESGASQTEESANPKKKDRKKRKSVDA